MTKMKILLTIFIFQCSATFGQLDLLNLHLSKLAKKDSIENPQLANTNGEVTLVTDSAIVSLEKSMRGFRDLRGYRVQIFVGTIDQAKSERNKYLNLGLTYSAYLKQLVPEYSLQVGDFTSRMEMEKNLEIIKKTYPKAFAVVENIEPPKYDKK